MDAISLDTKGQMRLKALMQWAEVAASSGHRVPEDSHLVMIAHTKVVAADGDAAAVVQMWEPTIAWMLTQTAFGVAEPFLQLPDELHLPVGYLPVPVEIATNAQPAPTDDGVAALLATETVVLTETHRPAAVTHSTAVSRTPKWELAAMEQVQGTIKRCIKPLEALRARDANEGDTRMVVTDLLCEGLDYDKFKDLTTEYMVKQDFADYGVRIDKQMVAFIEVKRISQKLNERHLRQVLMYAVNEGVEWMVLTNGAVWQAYHLTGGLPVVVDLAFEIDLLGPASLAEKTESMFLLHKEALKRRRIDEVWRHRAATEPGALLDVLLSEPVLDQLRKEVRRRTGIATTAESLSEVIRTEIVDPKLIAKLFKSSESAKR